jgi:hypothetical protein
VRLLAGARNTLIAWGGFRRMRSDRSLPSNVSYDALWLG